MSSPDSEGVSVRRPRVLVVVGNLDIGGVEMDILRTIPRLDRRLFDVSVYAFLGAGALGPALQAQGIELTVPNSVAQRPRHSTRCATITQTEPAVVENISRNGVSSRSNHLQTPKPPLLERLIRRGEYVTRILIPLFAYIVKHRIDIVHCFLPHAYVAGGLASVAVPRCKIVMSRVSSNFYMDEQPFYKIVERRLLHRFVDVAICNSTEIEQELIEEGIQKSKIRRIYNGINPADFETGAARRATARQNLGLNERQLVFSCVANLHPYKGHRDLLQALSLVSHALPADWRVLCAGSDVGRRKAVLEAFACDLGIREHVYFLGTVADIPEFLAASDIHVHPSHLEGMPNSILEAMASGLPVIATAVGGVPELITSEGAILIPPKTPEHMGAAVLELVNNRDTRQRMGASNRERAASQFSLNSTVLAYEAVYSELLFGRAN